MADTAFQKFARQALAAAKKGDCDGAKIATAKAIHRATTPHERNVLYKIQGKVRRCEIGYGGFGRARRKKKRSR